MEKFIIINTPIGFLKVKEENGFITAITYQNAPQELVDSDSDVLKLAKEQLNDYFKGSLKEFTLPIKITGTEFEKAVLNNLFKVPFGQTTTYKQLALAAGNEKASRAVGSVMRKNPFVIVLPCHRVLPASGKIGNYSAGGSGNKEWLLLHEKQNI